MGILEKSMDEAKTHLMTSSDYGFIHIPKNIVSDPDAASFYSRKQPGINTKEDLERVIRKELEDIKLINTIDQLNLSANDKVVALKIPETIKTRVSLTTIKLGEGAEEEETFAEASMVIGIFAGIIIYFFIFMFGVCSGSQSSPLEGLVASCSFRIRLRSSFNPAAYR